MFNEIDEFDQMIARSASFAQMITEECERGDFLIAGDAMPFTSQLASIASRPTQPELFPAFL